MGAQVAALQSKAATLKAAIHKAERMHDDVVDCAGYLTGAGADAMLAARAASDALELSVGDDYWPLPRYREMLFPV